MIVILYMNDGRKWTFEEFDNVKKVVMSEE